MSTKLEMLPRTSSKACIFTAALLGSWGAYGNSARHKSIMVECIHRLFQFHAHLFVGAKFACLTDEHLRHIGTDAPVALLVGMSHVHILEMNGESDRLKSSKKKKAAGAQ